MNFLSTSCSSLPYSTSNMMAPQPQKNFMCPFLPIPFASNASNGLIPSGVHRQQLDSLEECQQPNLNPWKTNAILSNYLLPPNSITPKFLLDELQRKLSLEYLQREALFQQQQLALMKMILMEASQSPLNNPQHTDTCNYKVLDLLHNCQHSPTGTAVDTDDSNSCNSTTVDCRLLQQLQQPGSLSEIGDNNPTNHMMRHNLPPSGTTSVSSNLITLASATPNSLLSVADDSQTSSTNSQLSAANRKNDDQEEEETDSCSFSTVSVTPRRRQTSCSRDSGFQEGITVGYTYETFFQTDGRSRRHPLVSPTPVTPATCEPGLHADKCNLLESSTTPVTTSRRYSCNECGRDYATSSNLSRHKQTHRNPQDSQAAKSCPECGRVYVSMPALAMHLKTHSLRHVCAVCGQRFARDWLLAGHMRTHTGEKPYGCAHCKKAFADRSNLRAHMQTHSEAKRFQCQCCGKRFELKAYLNKHMETAHAIQLQDHQSQEEFPIGDRQQQQ